MQEESFEVQYTQEGERLDKVLSEIYPDFSRSFFQKLIKNKQIQVSGAVQLRMYLAQELRQGTVLRHRVDVARR